MERKIATIKSAYPINLRLGMIGALLLSIALFALAPARLQIQAYSKTKTQEIISENIETQVEEIKPPEEQAKPAVPVEATSEAEVEAATIGETSFEEVYTTPETAVEAPIVPYQKLEKRPEPMNSPQPTYPQIAREQEMKGTVIIKVLLNTDGTVTQAEISKSSNYPILDNAALEVARKWTFTPAMQRNKPVRVWVSIPFTFTLEQ